MLKIISLNQLSTQINFLRDNVLLENSFCRDPGVCFACDFYPPPPAPAKFVLDAVIALGRMFT